MDEAIIRQEIEEFYLAHRPEFFRPERVGVAHIVKNIDERTGEAEARVLIEAVQAELRKGRPFGEVADELSDCPGNGGDLGYFARGTMVAEFESVVFAMKKGQTSRIFRTIFGFHIARVYARKAAGVPPLNEVRGEIERRLQRHETRI